jgi:4Fe-4S single cluster domain of Ferredoxin I
MEAELQSQVAFHLTGKRPSAGLEAVDPLALRPALLARYRDLGTLRYDFPLVLVEKAPGDAYVQALSGLIDGILREIAQGDDGERLTRHVLRLEQRIRMLAAQGTQGPLTGLWDAASGQLGAPSDAPLRDSLARARAALKVDGAVLGCDAALPGRLAKHAWSVVQQQKARQFGEDIGRLIQKLSDILKVDFAGSDAGRSADSLKASVGAAHAEVFDFAAMSRLLAKGSREAGLPPARRERIRGLLAVLEAQSFYPVPGRSPAAQQLSFLFDSCADALAAYRERSPKVVALAKAIAIAELEIAGEFRETQHAAFFDDFGEEGLDPEGLAPFPDYLICVNAHKLSASESSTLMEILSAGLPMKILVQTDDILAASRIGDGGFGFGTRDRQLATMAIGLNNVYVMQSSSANLFQFRGRLRAGLAYRGPALFSVFSGANVTTGDLPPYLVAAAAMESRVFPAFSYDPSAGPDWASRFDLQINPQAERDWPIHGFAYEDEAHQTVTEDIAFTLVDFVACDGRYAKHLALVPRAQWSEKMLSAAECLVRDPGGLGETVPCLSMVDRDNVLHKVIVDDRLMREARRCRELWHSLQELGGIHNSHAARLLARESKAREESASATTSAPAQPEAKPAPGPPAGAAATEAAPEKSSDEAYIETARCTSCNECTKINDKMFAYNENKQAYIADPAAGTYAQLVEAAESCQVSIIHPGKPRDPNEPGMEDLLRRAPAFQ